MTVKLDFYWTNPGFSSTEVMLTVTESQKVLAQWDNREEFLSFTTTTGNEHRVRVGEVRRLRVRKS